MRVYLPATVPLLRRLRAEGGLGADLTAHAVTPALREWYAGSDTDELEQAAFYDAERRSLRHLAADPTAVRRRVVVAADVVDDRVTPIGGDDDDDRSAVAIRGVVTLAVVASVHLDDLDAVPDVTAAIDALPGAGRGEEDAQFVVDGAEGHDLLWYDVTELDDLLDDLLGDLLGDLQQDGS